MDVKDTVEMTGISKHKSQLMIDFDKLGGGIIDVLAVAVGMKYVATTTSTFDVFVQRKYVGKCLYAEHGVECEGSRRTKCDYTKFHSAVKNHKGIS